MGQKTLVYFGHHKCGTVWTSDVLRYVSSFYGLRFANYHSKKQFNGNLKTEIQASKLDFAAYTNSNYEDINLDQFAGFHVIRDPRDVIVSAYFSHLNSHPIDGWPELVQHRSELLNLDESEGLLATMEFMQKMPIDGADTSPILAMRDWNYGDANIIEIKFEDLLIDPYTNWLLIAEKAQMLDDRELGAPILLNQMREILFSRYLKSKAPNAGVARWVWLMAVNANSFERKSGGRNQGQENNSSHFRKGVARDWLNHFKPEHKARFKEIYPNVLSKTGYETQSDW